MPVYEDFLGRAINIPATPRRIISLVPSQTELLAYLGLQEQIIGLTKFCIHPASLFNSCTRIGGTKQLNIDLIRELNPDLILANKEENIKEQIEQLAENFPVWISDVHDIPSAFRLISELGNIFSRQEQANQLVAEIKHGFQSLIPQAVRPRVCYLIWKDPYMTVGGDTFIHAMLNAAGYDNAFAEMNRYPTIDLPAIRNSGCNLILLSSEPFPFKEKHITAIREKLPDIPVILVDGEMFSWYGSRMLHAISYFNKLPHLL